MCFLVLRTACLDSQTPASLPTPALPDYLCVPQCDPELHRYLMALQEPALEVPYFALRCAGGRVGGGGGSGMQPHLQHHLQHHLNCT